MKYIYTIMLATILFSTNTDAHTDSEKNNQKTLSDDIAYNNQYQQNRGGYNTYSNQSAYHLDQAGQHLKNFRDRYYTGFALTVGGQVVMVAGAGSESPGTLLLGAGVSLVGVVMSFLSYSEAGKAGNELQQASRAMQ